jgi:hypothetical protein
MNSQLRRSLDRNESFLNGGHQTVGARTYKRTAPGWTKDDKFIRGLLLQSFPKLASNDNQREAAGRWATVIHLYFRMGYTRSQIAEELGSTEERIKGVIRSIYRASKGKRADGSGTRTRGYAPKTPLQRKVSSRTP